MPVQLSNRQLTAEMAGPPTQHGLRLASFTLDSDPRPDGCHAGTGPRFGFDCAKPPSSSSPDGQAHGPARSRDWLRPAPVKLLRTHVTSLWS